MSTVDEPEAVKTIKAFRDLGDMLSRGWDHQERNVGEYTVKASTMPDTDTSLDDYDRDIYSELRRREYLNGDWSYIIIVVAVYDRTGVSIVETWGPEGERHLVGRLSIGAVESDSPGDYLASLIESLYDEIMVEHPNHVPVPVEPFPMPPAPPARPRPITDVRELPGYGEPCGGS